MFDKIIQKGGKRRGENIVNAIVEQMEKRKFIEYRDERIFHI